MPNMQTMWSWLTLKLAALSSAVKAWWSKQGPLLAREKLLYALTLLALAWLLTGCATNSAPSETMPRNPPPPQPSQSQPSATYSSSAAADIASWLKSLTDMRTIP